MCCFLKSFIKFVIGFLVIALISVYVYYNINGKWDDWICDKLCKDNGILQSKLTQEKKIIGIYKIREQRCDCYIIFNDMEKIYRDTYEKIRYEQKGLAKRIKRLYANIVLKFRRER